MASGLEVVAEAEVAEHLEERVVARRVADVLEVVVLAACAHAALRARRALVAALVLAEEDVLELDHAGVGEEERRVVAGHERGRRHDRVAARAEELQECAAELAAGQSSFSLHRHQSSPGNCPTAARTCSALNPRWLRNRACRPRWIQVVGSLVPKRLRRTSAQRACQLRRIRVDRRCDLILRHTGLAQLVRDSDGSTTAIGMIRDEMLRVAGVIHELLGDKHFDRGDGGRRFDAARDEALARVRGRRSRGDSAV